MISLKDTRIIVMFAIFCMSSLFVFTRFSTAINDISEYELKICCMCLIVAYVYCAYMWIKSTNRIFSMYFFLLVACFLFNAGQVIMQIFDIDYYNFFIVFDNYSNELIYKAVLFQIAAIISMTFGAIVATTTSKSIPKEQNAISVSGLKGDVKTDKVDLMFYIVLILFVVISIIRLMTRSSISYDDFASSGNTSSPLYSPILFIFYIVLMYQFRRYSNQTKIKQLLVISALACVLILLFGARFKTVPIVAGVVIMMFIVKGARVKISKWKWVVLILATIILFSLMRGWTSLRLYSLSDIDWNLIKNVYSGGLLLGFKDTLAECGASLRVLISTMYYIDNGYVDSQNTILYALSLAIVPKKFVSFLGLVPSIGSLSAWITTQTHATVGLGYSIFAEAYFNFHVFGTLYFLIFGYVYARLEAYMLKLYRFNDVWSWILAGAIMFMLGDAIFLARADLILCSSNMRRCLYIWIVRNIIMHHYNNKSYRSRYASRNR